jgi:RNA polymerase sigma-70 factor (ECF subfamily)
VADDRSRLLAGFTADARDAAPAHLADALARLRDAGRAAWPGLPVDDEVLGRFLGARLAAEELGPGAEPLATADLYLACACFTGAPGASEALVRACEPPVRAALARAAPPTEQPEVLQRVWAHLLVADGDTPPRIGQYRGRGSLIAFVRVAAVRLAISASRKQRPSAADELEVQRLADEADDPELQYLKQLYRTEFRTSFTRAFEGLPAAQQLLLRLDIVDHLTIDQAAAVYGRSRTTTGRHLLEARQALARATLTDLQTRLALQPTEVTSIARLVRSQIDLSVQRILIAGEK